MLEGNAECQPLKTLIELLSWQKNEVDWSILVNKQMSRSSHCYMGSDLKCRKKGQRPAKQLSSSVPKTLICHDMKGGYLDDKYVHGVPYESQYLFYHWSVIDVFVYFSHHFVTIPPLMWINAAHNHGVQILGTIITEHTEGEQIWNEILRDESTQNQVADQLVAIQQHYRFDGYLLNIENKIDPPLLPKLINFLRQLKSKMGRSMLIWYDAVSFIDGKLKWQNELNEHNQPAFEICDGVFLNYGWKSDNLQTSLNNAGVRLHDVYVGVDVFGRNVHVGGGFNTDQALSMVRSFNLSAAIFAFGWTHETQAGDREFFTVENEFWRKLFPYLYVHYPNLTPFRTNFNFGIGFHDQKERELWYNLSLQSFHLILPSCINAEREEKSVQSDPSFHVSVLHGGFLMQNFTENEIEVHKLMMCDFNSSEDNPLKFSISVKPIAEFRHFQVLLHGENDGRNFLVFLKIGENKDWPSNKPNYGYSSHLSDLINSTRIASTTPEGWINNDFQLKFEGIISQINVIMGQSTRIGRLSFE